MGKLLVKIKSSYNRMTKQEKRISDYFLDPSNNNKILSITKLSDICNVGEATIVRYAKKLGFIGYPDFKIAIANDIKTVTSMSLKENDSLTDVYSKMCDDIYSTLLSTKAKLKEEDLEKCFEILENAENIGIYGVGSSGCVAGDAAHKLLRIGFNVRPVTDGYMQLIHARIATKNTAIFLLTHSGVTKEIIDAGTVAKEQGAKIILITSNEKSPLCSIADVCLFTTSCETNYRMLGLTSRYASLAFFDSLHEYIILHNEKRKETVIGVEETTASKRKIIKRL